MKRASLSVFAAALAMCLSASLAHATTIADWTFETSAPITAGPFSPEIGAGSATGSHAGASTYSSPAGNGSAHSFSSNNWAVGDYYQFQVSTVGLSGITFQWDQTSSGTGPRDFQLSYSTNGTTFTNFGGTVAVLPNAAPNPVWNTTTSSPLYTTSDDLSGVSALDNQATVFFRITNNSTSSANGTGTTQTGGTSRVDNVIVATVPEPASLVLAGLGLVGLIGIARRRG